MVEDVSGFGSIGGAASLQGARAQEAEQRPPLERAHGQLAGIMGLIADLRPLIEGASPDTFFAFGEAIGTISKAKALLGRDIDDRRRAR